MMEKKKRKIPELLVPAGGYEQLRAAVANGADAVYLSGSSFNARINADNFNDETLADAVRFAHEHGVRVHVTLNTLIREEEREDAVRFAEKCRDLGADALILQDRGLSAELMRRIPDMTFHLSTQGTVYDRRGVEEAFRAGFQRVILSRELSLREMRRDLQGHGSGNRSVCPRRCLYRLFRAVSYELCDRRTKRKSGELRAALPSAV